MRINTITSFTVHDSGGWTRISATYSQVDENGKVLIDNDRFNIVVVDEDAKDAIKIIKDLLLTKIPEQEE